MINSTEPPNLAVCCRAHVRPVAHRERPALGCALCIAERRARNAEAFKAQRLAATRYAGPFAVGARVTTPQGPGTVRYVRMAPPDFAQVSQVSVALDSVTRAGYEGTLFFAAQVRALEPSEV